MSLREAASGAWTPFSSCLTAADASLQYINLILILLVILIISLYHAYKRKCRHTCPPILCHISQHAPEKHHSEERASPPAPAIFNYWWWSLPQRRWAQVGQVNTTSPFVSESGAVWFLFVESTSSPAAGFGFVRLLKRMAWSQWLLGPPMGVWQS